MTGRSEPTLTALQQHQRQPEREQHAHDDDGDETHAPERLALNVGDAEESLPEVMGRTDSLRCHNDAVHEVLIARHEGNTVPNRPSLLNPGDT